MVTILHQRMKEDEGIFIFCCSGGGVSFIVLNLCTRIDGSTDSYNGWGEKNLGPSLCDGMRNGRQIGHGAPPYPPGHFGWEEPSGLDMKISTPLSKFSVVEFLNKLP